MPEPPVIPDMHLFSLERANGRLQILRRNQHLLRRFGLLELLELGAGDKTDFTLRGDADEICVPIEGRLSATLVDRRAKSPSSGLQVDIELDADQPHGLLIPFGVAHAFTAHTRARLLRLATHADGDHPDDQTLPAADLIAPSG